MAHRTWEMPNLGAAPRAVWEQRRGAIERLPERYLADD